MAYEAWTVEWDMPVLADDRFNRYASYTWGGNWTTSGGTPDNFNANGQRGTITLPTGDTAARVAVLPGTCSDFDAYATMRCAQLATGNSLFEQIVARWASVNDHYRFSLAFDASGNVDVSIIRNVGGSGLTLQSTLDVVSYTATTDVYVHAQGRGTTLRVKVWTGNQDQPPDAWTVETSDSSHASGQMGVRAIMAGGNTNTNPVMLIDDFRVTVPERWVDVTAYVDTARGGAESGGSPFTIAAGDTPEASTDTGGVGLPLLNADQRFTPGNTVSPYYPNIAPGSRIRVRETILDQRFDRFTGYVQYPEIAAWTESNSDSPRDQLIVIPVVDRAAWIAQGRKFVSTLAEHIIYHGGPSLIGYWPMNEAEGPDVNPFIGGQWPLTAARKRLPGYHSAASIGQPTITFGNTGIPLADDITSVGFSPTTITDPSVDYFDSIALQGRRSATVTLGAGQVVTVVGWTRPGNILIGALNGTASLIEFQYQSGVTLNYASIWVNSAGNLVGGANSPNWGGSVTGPPAPPNHAMPIAVRVGYDPPVLELWVRNEVYTGTNVVTSAVSALLDTMVIADRYPGTVNHVQVYLGSATDWTHDDFVAQYELGLYGMERQSTGERIRNILQYAGVDPIELGRIDDGVSLMQVARIAGRDPMDLVAEAVETEQGEFYIAGDNRPVFADRVRLYNI